MKSLVLTSKSASPQKCPVLGSKTALFFDLLKVDQGHDRFCLVFARELAKNFLKTFFFWRTLEIFEKFTKLWSKDLFFFWRSLLRCVLGPWPWHRTFLSLASRGSVLGRALLGLRSFYVLCLGLELFVLDSTSGNNVQFYKEPEW